MDTITIPEGTLIHIQGVPFVLPANTEVLGNKANLSLIELDERPPQTGNVANIATSIRYQD